MTNRGDDCYFFYYSTCTKGDSCPFRHCQAAFGSETVCTLWQDGRCFRNTCKFRHMEITHNRKEIPCYWENQASGCQKPHCAFFHEKPRYIDGVFVSPDKGLSKNVEQPQEEPASVQPPAASSQRRDAIKMDAQVPSPTHPPVVINPAEDEDEDEDEDADAGLSPRKLPSSGDSLHFGVSTVEEIRLKKALKASMRRAGYAMMDEDTSSSKEKENIQAMFGPDLSDTSDGSLFEVLEEASGPKVNVSERLGKRLHADGRRGDNGPQGHRLGRSTAAQAAALKPVRERLGRGAGPAAAAHPAEAVVEPHKPPAQIHVKTLEEIRLEKAARLKDAPETSSSRAAGSEKTVLTARDLSPDQGRTPSEVCSAKRKRIQEQQPESGAEKVPGRSQAEEPAGAGTGPPEPNTGVRVKTLEEIRREKAARVGSKQVSRAENNRRDGEKVVKKPRLLRINKASVPLEKGPEGTEKPPRAPAAAAAAETRVSNGNGVKVKTFEEIMQEKRLRKQELEEQTKGSAEAGAVQNQNQNQSSDGALKRKAPSTDSSSPAATKVPLRKIISIKSKPASSPLSRAGSQSPEQNLAQPEQEPPADPKVRPKLNVRPSVMKPSVQLRKRRGAERSAMAAVKPLNSSSAPQEAASPSADAQLSSAVPCGAVVDLDPGSGSSPLKEELQTVPVFGQGQETPSEACTVPQSPALKTPPPSKTRRSSAAASRSLSSSAMDDFEELISEFADDHLVQGEMDTDIGEDDLLQELSQMIDS